MINLVTGDGKDVSEVALAHPDLAGIHFTGSTATFQHLWRTVGENIANYRTYPRLVGETGGKDFIVAHPSADPAVLKTAMTRGAFEYQGQKCSAASRAYVPRSLWDDGLKDELAAEVEALAMGDVTDLSQLHGRRHRRPRLRQEQGRDRPGRSPTRPSRSWRAAPTTTRVGYFVRPTVLVSTDPANEIFKHEYFGPILAVYVYEDDEYDAMLEQMESASPYAPDRRDHRPGPRRGRRTPCEALRFAAGNFYINDKPTGAVVGQQPFGGGRASGTNDKAGVEQNLMRWTSTRSIKETLVPPTDYRYPHMG